MDTVKIVIGGLLKARIMEVIKKFLVFRLNGWTVQMSVQTGSLGSGAVTCFSAIHRDPFIRITGRITGRDGKLNRVTCHLPEILHGYNGVQIKSQRELDQALAILLLIVAEIADNIFLENFLRIDFAFNIPCDPSQTLNALKGVRHPLIRKTATAYQHNAIQLKGVSYTLSIYNKSHRRTDKSGFPHDRHFSPGDNHLRVEVQAKTKAAVRKLFDAPYRTLDFAALWASARKFIAMLPAGTRSGDPCTLFAALALLEQNNIRHPSGLTSIEWWMAGKEPETIRKELRKIKAIQHTWSPFSLVDLIPETPPVDFLDVLRDGSTRMASVNPSPTP